MSVWLKTYAFGIGNIPMMSKSARKTIDRISKLDNLVGIQPQYPYGTLIVFTDENSAKIGRNVLKSHSIECGGISPCSIDKIYVDESVAELMEEADVNEFPYMTNFHW